MLELIHPYLKIVCLIVLIGSVVKKITLVRARSKPNLRPPEVILNSNWSIGWANFFDKFTVGVIKTSIQTRKAEFLLGQSVPFSLPVTQFFKAPYEIVLRIRPRTIPKNVNFLKLMRQYPEIKFGFRLIGTDLVGDFQINHSESAQEVETKFRTFVDQAIKTCEIIEAGDYTL